MYRSNYENDFMFDWVLKKSGKQIGPESFPAGTAVGAGATKQ
jgi:hypothetical protein